MVFSAFPILASATPIGGNDLFTGKHLEVPSGKKGTVLIFLSAQCPCSQSHVASLKKLSEEYKDFTFIAIHSNSDEGKDFTQKYFKEIDLKFAVIQDSDGKIADKFRALKTPHAFVLDEQGKILYKGGMTDSHDGGSANKQYLKEALNDLSKGQTVRLAETRTLGCHISRSAQNVW